MIDILDRLRFDAIRCEVQFSKGVAANIDAGVTEIERLRDALQLARSYIKPSHDGDIQADADLRTIDEALAPTQAHDKAMR